LKENIDSYKKFEKNNALKNIVKHCWRWIKCKSKRTKFVCINYVHTVYTFNILVYLYTLIYFATAFMSVVRLRHDCASKNNSYTSLFTIREPKNGRRHERVCS